MPISRVRIEMNKNGVQELLKSAKVEAELKRRADLIAAAAGEGMEASSRIGSTRARASVRTETLEAILSEATERSLTRAIEAGRG